MLEQTLSKHAPLHQMQLVMRSHQVAHPVGFAVEASINDCTAFQ